MLCHYRSPDHLFPDVPGFRLGAVRPPLAHSDRRQNRWKSRWRWTVCDVRLRCTYKWPFRLAVIRGDEAILGIIGVGMVAVAGHVTGSVIGNTGGADLIVRINHRQSVTAIQRSLMEAVTVDVIIVGIADGRSGSLLNPIQVIVRVGPI